jgi:hypothetical protein
LNKLYPPEELSKMILNLNQEFTNLIEELYPLVKNDAFFIPILLNDLSIIQFLEGENINDHQRSLLRQLITEKLKNYRKRIDTLISSLN